MMFALDFVTSTSPPTEAGQEYVLQFRNLGLVTPYPRLAAVFYENRNIPMILSEQLVINIQGASEKTGIMEFCTSCIINGGYTI
jgi:hypothetical protein